jgi:hypothetical protein
MQRISKVGWKYLSHEIQFRNVHKQMIQLKGTYDVSVMYNEWK